MDVAFIIRSLRMALVLSVLGYMLAAVYVNDAWGLGFLLGALWSVANLYLIKGLIQRVVTPEVRSLTGIVIHAAIKFPLLYVGGFFILSSGLYPPSAPTLGFTLPFVVIVLKAGGRLMLGIEGTGSGRNASPAGIKSR